VIEGADPALAAHELAEAVSVLVERPAIEAAIAAATERLDREWSDEAWAEQQRLLGRESGLEKRELELKARLGQTASARGSYGEADAGSETTFN
jgi:DNA primase